jgi:biotin operon repressor
MKDIIMQDNEVWYSQKAATEYLHLERTALFKKLKELEASGVQIEKKKLGNGRYIKKSDMDAHLLQTLPAGDWLTTTEAEKYAQMSHGAFWAKVKKLEAAGVVVERVRIGKEVYIKKSDVDEHINRLEDL